jgi:hypothetical protein
MGGGRGVPSPSSACGSDHEPNRWYWRCCGCCCRCVCRGGYLATLVVAYAVGLALANAAVYWMEMGQPALLYLVPTCLGTMTYLGWRRNELSQLWDGPRVLKAADDIVFGPATTTTTSSASQHQQHAPLPTNDDEDYDGADIVLAPPSAVTDEEEDDAMAVAATASP